MANITEIKSVLGRINCITNEEILAVGGAVRDAALGYESDDIDIASRVRPEEMIELCEKFDIEVHPTGLDHGTVTIVLRGHKLEHTTFRRDVETDGRNATVEYADTFEEDARRRDFTINALAMDEHGDFRDPCGGMEDIKKGVVRTVGQAEQRFREDYLRIIRMARFAGRYDFAIGEDTSAAAMELAPYVPDYVAVERVTMEINKAFADETPSQFFRLMEQYNLLSRYLPRISHGTIHPQSPEYHPEGNVFEHTMEVVDAIDGRWENGWPVRHWAALLHDVGEMETFEPAPDGWWETYHGHEKAGAELIEEIADRLKFPNWLKRDLEVMVRHHMYPLHIQDHAEDGTVPDRLRRRFQQNVKGHLEDMEALCRADAEGRRPRGVWDLFEPLETPPDRVLDGDDLIEAGYEPGPSFGPMLQAAHEHQIESGCRDKEALLEVAEEARP
jgi:putative nucleotidyltransferase with HDIG domain